MTRLCPGFLDERMPDQPASEDPPTVAADPGEAPPAQPILFEPEDGAPTTLRISWTPEQLAPPSAGLGTLGWTAAGLGTLLVTWATMSCISFLLALAERSFALSAIGAVGVALGLGLLAYAAAGEWRAYKALRRVDSVRAALAHDGREVQAARDAALAWLRRISCHIPGRSEAEQALDNAKTVAEVRSILRSRVAVPLRAAAGQIGKRAAIQAGSMIALSPHASWDGLIAGMRGIAVMRQVAQLYGVRPGPTVTFALMRKVAWTAAGTAGLDLLSRTLADQALSAMPVAKHLAGILAGTSFEARRLYRLAGITAEACCPVPA